MTRGFKIFWMLVIFYMLFISLSNAGTTSTSGVTAGVIAERSRTDLNAIASSGVTDAGYTNENLYQWIDEAVRIIVNKTRCLESGVSNVVLKENTHIYAIGGSFLDIEAIDYDMGLSGNTPNRPQIKGLDRVEKRLIGHGKDVKGDPTQFVIWNNSIEIYPIPRSDQSGTTLYVYKINLPSGVTTSTSLIETPAYLDPAIPVYVKAKGLYKFEQNASGDKQMALFHAMINEFIVSVQRRKPIE